MKAIELFCGIGVAACGVKAAGHELLLAADQCQAAVEAFNQSREVPPVAQVVNLQNVKPSDLRDGSAPLWCAGPPCQPFSQGGALFGRGGPQDQRNGFPALLHLVAAHLPRHLLIENTIGLGQFGGYMAQLQSAFEELDYKVTAEEIDCYDFGVPQHRRRLVVLLTRGRSRWRVMRPARRPDGPRTLGDCMQPVPAGDRWPLLLPLSPKALAYWSRDARHAQKHPPLRMDEPASTVVANYARGVPYGVIAHGSSLWTCGPRLAARLQGVPDTYDLGDKRTPILRGIGNGFPAPVVEHLLRQIP